MRLAGATARIGAYPYTEMASYQYEIEDVGSLTAEPVGWHEWDVVVQHGLFLREEFTATDCRLFESETGP